jgi:hypothetical protein
MHADVVRDTTIGIREAGGQVEPDLETDLIRVNGEFTASIVIARCFARPRAWPVLMESGFPNQE